MADEYDFVVVGAGSAGCVLAERLSSNGDRVCLLEAGPADRHPMIHIPAGILSLLAHPVLNWNYSSEPDPATHNRAIHWPRGKVLGGSSSINGMLYVRGNPADYDTWAQSGCRGWTYDDVLPFFQRSESYAAGEDDYRGRDGPLVVEDYHTILPLTHRFVEASQHAGLPLTEDYNGKTQEGVGYSQMTRRGRLRGSTARTYLTRAKSRANMRIETNAMATGLVFESNRCVGVEFVRDGHRQVCRARAEVILSGGAINSPHLLQVSGVGPGGLLSDLGIEVRHDSPGVGQNLSDHYVARISHRVIGETSINELSRGVRLGREVLRWLIEGKGALTFGVTSAMVFCRSREGLQSPDLQLLFTPASYDNNRFGALERSAGMTVAVCPVRPRSRGSIDAVSSDPLARPRISPNYLGDIDDLQVMKSGIEITRRIFEMSPLAEVSGGETLPGVDVVTDDEIEHFVRSMGGTIYHPVGTCKMGTDPMAVVDERLRVHGLEGLRVIDASIMPNVTTGNTNAPTIMIAEKGAAMIAEDHR